MIIYFQSFSFTRLEICKGCQHLNWKSCNLMQFPASSWCVAVQADLAMLLVAQWLECWCASLVAQVWILAVSFRVASIEVKLFIAMQIITFNKFIWNESAHIKLYSFYWWSNLKIKSKMMPELIAMQLLWCFLYYV